MIRSRNAAPFPLDSSRGAVAQLGERLNGIQEVRGSIPLGSTKSPFAARQAPAAARGGAHLFASASARDVSSWKPRLVRMRVAMSSRDVREGAASADAHGTNSLKFG